MARFRNISPLGDLEVPALRITVDAGADFDVEDLDIADQLCDQSGMWEPIGYARRKPIADELASDDVMPPASAELDALEQLTAEDQSQL